MKNFKIIKIDDERWVLGGLYKTYQETGLPIGIQIDTAIKEGLNVSILHLADEMLKEMPIERAERTIKEESGLSNFDFDLDEVREFLHASYEDQREMIFQNLFVRGDSRMSSKVISRARSVL